MYDNFEQCQRSSMAGTKGREKEKGEIKGKEKDYSREHKGSKSSVL